MKDNESRLNISEIQNLTKLFALSVSKLTNQFKASLKEASNQATTKELSILYEELSIKLNEVIEEKLNLLKNIISKLQKRIEELYEDIANLSKLNDTEVKDFYKLLEIHSGAINQALKKIVEVENEIQELLNQEIVEIKHNLISPTEKILAENELKNEEIITQIKKDEEEISNIKEKINQSQIQLAELKEKKQELESLIIEKANCEVDILSDKKKVESLNSDLNQINEIIKKIHLINQDNYLIRQQIKQYSEMITELTIKERKNFAIERRMKEDIAYFKKVAKAIKTDQLESQMLQELQERGGKLFLELFNREIEKYDGEELNDPMKMDVTVKIIDKLIENRVAQINHNNKEDFSIEQNSLRSRKKDLDQLFFNNNMEINSLLQQHNEYSRNNKKSRLQSKLEERKRNIKNESNKLRELQEKIYLVVNNEGQEETKNILQQYDQEINLLEKEITSLYHNHDEAKKLLSREEVKSTEYQSEIERQKSKLEQIYHKIPKVNLDFKGVKGLLSKCDHDIVNVLKNEPERRAIIIKLPLIAEEVVKLTEKTMEEAFTRIYDMLSPQAFRPKISDPNKIYELLIEELADEVGQAIAKSGLHYIIFEDMSAYFHEDVRQLQPYTQEVLAQCVELINNEMEKSRDVVDDQISFALAVIEFANTIEQKKEITKLEIEKKLAGKEGEAKSRKLEEIKEYLEKDLTRQCVTFAQNFAMEDFVFDIRDLKFTINRQKVEVKEMKIISYCNAVVLEAVEGLQDLINEFKKDIALEPFEREKILVDEFKQELIPQPSPQVEKLENEIAEPREEQSNKISDKVTPELVLSQTKIANETIISKLQTLSEDAKNIISEKIGSSFNRIYDIIMSHTSTEEVLDSSEIHEILVKEILDEISQSIARSGLHYIVYEDMALSMNKDAEQLDVKGHKAISDYIEKISDNLEQITDVMEEQIEFATALVNLVKSIEQRREVVKQEIEKGTDAEKIREQLQEDLTRRFLDFAQEVEIEGLKFDFDDLEFTIDMENLAVEEPREDLAEIINICNKIALKPIIKLNNLVDELSNERAKERSVKVMSGFLPHKEEVLHEEKVLQPKEKIAQKMPEIFANKGESGTKSKLHMPQLENYMQDQKRNIIPEFKNPSVTDKKAVENFVKGIAKIFESSTKDAFRKAKRGQLNQEEVKTLKVEVQEKILKTFSKLEMGFELKITPETVKQQGELLQLSKALDMSQADNKPLMPLVAELENYNEALEKMVSGIDKEVDTCIEAYQKHSSPYNKAGKVVSTLAFNLLKALSIVCYANSMFACLQIGRGMSGILSSFLAPGSSQHLGVASSVLNAVKEAISYGDKFPAVLIGMAIGVVVLTTTMSVADLINYMKEPEQLVKLTEGFKERVNNVSQIFAHKGEWNLDSTVPGR